MNLLILTLLLLALSLGLFGQDTIKPILPTRIAPKTIITRFSEGITVTIYLPDVTQSEIEAVKEYIYYYYELHTDKTLRVAGYAPDVIRNRRKTFIDFYRYE